ncbi:hypothetical protein L2E82_21132 [Cichorium intybus]|uniref:Uncharacterized protein n=1 Tax=Cichorium intybus TaxID=13427 RepID=A0ACB9DVJ1_CICIN|nr:hypothetical protein L2E82_21132 [Cichorium intybus]
MAHMTQLPPELVNLILILLATSNDGARDLARASATCKMLRDHAEKSPVLRVVNFQKLTFTTYDYLWHHHTKDLLFRCARVGHQAAQSILGKALLLNDPWFWSMIFGDNQRAYHRIIPSCEALHHHNLVRTFILNAASRDIAVMSQQLVNYVITYAGYYAPRENGLIFAISDLCNFELARLTTRRIGSNQVHYRSFKSSLIWLEPPYESLYRDTVVMLFDKLFPSARD